MLRSVVTFDELESILGEPARFGPLALASGPNRAGRVHVDLSQPTYSQRHFATWYCLLPEDDSIPPGTLEAVDRYCLAVEDEQGDWTISASCNLHAARLHE